MYTLVDDCVNNVLLQTVPDINKAVIDRRLRPGVATWAVTLSVRWPAIGITEHSL